MLRLLPWEYGIRNLFRRPLRAGLTFCALCLVILLVLTVIGFVRGLERSLAVSGRPEVVLLYGRGMGENLEYSSIPMRTGQLAAASIGSVKQRGQRKYVSPELYLGTRIRSATGSEGLGLVRGVTPAALLVHDRVEIISGNWPEPDEVLVGRLAATKLGLSEASLQPGRTIELEGRQWTISGTMAAGGSAFDSEVWCRLDDLQQAMKRQDLSLVAMTLSSASKADFARTTLFCAQRLDLELQAMRQSDYYDTLQEGYAPVRWLSWTVVWLIAGAGVLAGLNAMYGSVVGRVRELATLQTVGFLRRAILLSIVQEGVLLAMAASMTAAALALLLLKGATVRFTMGAFELMIDGQTLLIGCGIGLLLGLVGSLPPAFRALKLNIVDGLRST